MPKFKSEGGQRFDVWVGSEARSVVVEGEYETSDKGEIEALRDHPHIEEAKSEKKSKSKK
jgi:hypothetical protein